jgi:hypothetical protein
VVATDNCGSAAVTQNPVPGTTLSIGDTVVTLTAMDDSDNSNTCSAVVTVVDLTPPDLTCPADIETPCAGTNGIQLVFAPPAVSDACDPSPQIVFTPPSGSIFTEGVHAVDCQVTDAGGNSADCTFFVTVRAPDLVIESYSDGEITWTYPTNAVHEYLVECCSDLSEGLWTDLGCGLSGVAPTGCTMTVQVPMADALLFYRIKAVSSAPANMAPANIVNMPAGGMRRTAPCIP